jgi:hypothetical protein
MINIVRLIKDIYDDRELIDSRLRTFADDHIIRLANNNPGSIYDPMIAATTAAYTAYYGAFNNELVIEAVTQGLTIATNNAATAVKNKLSNQQKYIDYTFGEGSEIYQEFFPYGMTEYHNARIDDLGSLLERYVTAANTHLTPAQVGEVVPLVTAFTTARTAQRTAFSQTDTLRTGRRDTRKALTMQLTRNTLALASDHLGNVDVFDNYFDLTLLPISRGDSDSVATGSVVISGLVQSSGTGTFIVNARLWVSHGGEVVEAFTGSDGRYELVLEDLEYTTELELNAQAAGHSTQTRPITIEPDTDQTQDFTLVPLP